MEALLHTLRRLRSFDTEKHTNSKIQRINKFFIENNLDAVVLGISGGIDSAVTLSLFVAASLLPDSPIKKIVGLNLPIFSTGTTDQSSTIELTQLLSNKYVKYDHVVIQTHDLTSASQSYININPNNADNFAIGQLAPIVRTPYVYFQAAILQEQGYKSIVSGTINRDEGAYIGYFGKASDAMVDIQPIADFHKSEIYQIAKYLDIPQEIIDATPKGDVHDGKTDEQMIGATYDQIEFVSLLSDYREYAYRNNLRSGVVSRDEPWYRNIEAHHQKNDHKYKVGMPSHFIDVLPRKVFRGWS